MRVLVIGQGGREHALAWKLAQSHLVEQVFVAPGNAGTALENNLTNVDISVLDFPALIAFAHTQKINLTVVGPEAPLAAGITDAFLDAGLACFGPNQAGAQLEASKEFSKAFMARHNIPTAQYASFTQVDVAKAYVQEQGVPIVIKADGLAAGKGVVIAQTIEEAEQCIDDMLSSNVFGAAGARIVIEAFLTGEEASFMAITDGQHIVPLASSQDHKARDNGDRGPNTGGMGAYSPAPVVTDMLAQAVMDKVMRPTLEGLRSDGIDYCGFLYAGLMIQPDGQFQVLEFNCRLGDPETQVLMMRLQSDLAALCLAACQGALPEADLQWTPETALGVVMAAGGYPKQYRKGDTIGGLQDIADANEKVFHAGTQLHNNQVVTQGGRVLCVAALGDTVETAYQKAYQAVDKIHWDDVYYRTDIGHRALSAQGKRSELHEHKG